MTNSARWISVFYLNEIHRFIRDWHIWKAFNFNLHLLRKHLRWGDTYVKEQALILTNFEWPVLTMDYGWVNGGFVPSQTHVLRFAFRFWTMELEVESLELQMLPCLSPCVSSTRQTHRLLEKLNPTNPILRHIPARKEILEKLGLWLDNPVSESRQSFRVPG